MQVDADASARVYGNDVDAAFEDMDAHGEHGLAVTLIATALEEVQQAGGDAALIVGDVLARVQTLVHAYLQRETPVQYV